MVCPATFKDAVPGAGDMVFVWASVVRFDDLRSLDHRRLRMNAVFLVHAPDVGLRQRIQSFAESARHVHLRTTNRGTKYVDFSCTAGIPSDRSTLSSESAR